MAPALLLTRAGLLAGAFLFRLVSPINDDLPTPLNGTPVLIVDGEKGGRHHRSTVFEASKVTRSSS